MGALNTGRQDGVVIRCRTCGTATLMHRDHMQPGATCQGADDADPCGAQLFPGGVVTSVSLEALQMSLDRD